MVTPGRQLAANELGGPIPELAPNPHEARSLLRRLVPALVWLIAVSGAPDAQADDPVVAAAGDIACDPSSSSFNGGLGTTSSCRMRYTSDLLLDPAVTAVLTLGDNQYDDGTLSEFLGSYDSSWGRVKSITHPSVGNHEYGTSGAGGYFDYFSGVSNQTGPAGDRSRGYYSFEVGAWHLIALNSSCSDVGGCGAGSPQEQWLRADLAAHPNRCTLAYWHHPRFSSGRYSNDPDTQGLWQALFDHQAEIALSGHDHNYQRYAPLDASGNPHSRGVRQFVVGTGGKSHYSIDPPPITNREAANGDTYGVLKLTLHPTSYDWTFVPEAGKTFTDTGSWPCNGSSAYARPRGAVLQFVSLVPASQPCSQPDRRHGGALAYASCNPPSRASNLAVGTPDVNGETVKFSGWVRAEVVTGNPATPEDEANMRVDAHVVDVRRASALDYVGELEARLRVRITDRSNTLAGGGEPEAATVIDLPLEVTMPCAATSDTTIGSTCTVSTTADVAWPGSVVEGHRSIWEAEQIEVFDGGADGLASTNDNARFLTQGLFLP